MIEVRPRDVLCEPRMRRFQTRWPSGYPAAALCIVHQALTRPEIQQAAGSSADPKRITAVLQEFGPLCCLIGHDVADEIIDGMLAGNEPSFRATIEKYGPPRPDVVDTNVPELEPEAPYQVPKGWEKKYDPAVRPALNIPGGPDAITGWIARRPCGCELAFGVRVDNSDPVFGIEPCELHDAEVEDVLQQIRELPPSEENVMQLGARLLEERIICG